VDRRSITVSGIVQGVGFRPFVNDLAHRLDLAGFVKNRTGDVLIELEGESQSLDRFLDELTTRPPPLARIAGVEWVRDCPRGDRHFRIEPSEGSRTGPIFVSPDIATCDDCLRELFDPADRRYRYPFLNCTNCGPRLTIIQGAPYDRENTTMAGFAMCPSCRSEYEDPSDRRYHAQPTACAVCGPRLQVFDGQGRVLDESDPLARAVAELREGKIVAIKSLGGYHLACLAGDDRAVIELRHRKHRDEKPLAVMVRDIRAALDLCDLGDAEQTLLTSSRRPIVLLRRKANASIAGSVASRNPWLGVMLAYTPLHHLLMDDLGGLPLVMTSGNRSDEPIAYDDADARERLAGIADILLTNNRPIHIRCDDSVTRIVAGVELPLRRARGDAPRPLDLPFGCRRPTLALGGQLKAAFALGRDRHAFLSHHLGDLDHYEAYRAYVATVEHYERLFAIRPERIVHDLHPDYATSGYARARGEAEGIELLAIQHHHAHVASCMAENGRIEPVIGVAFDGTGYGDDGAIWGGEFLVGDYRKFHRKAHLRYVGMPGGDRAIHDPWRMAAAHLEDAAVGSDILKARIWPAEYKIIAKMLHAHIRSPRTSSVGRLFDAIAAIVGVRDRTSYEGQAAIELEWLAMEESPDGRYPFAIDSPREESTDAPVVVDTRPIIRAVADEVARGVRPARVARRFHSTIVELIATVCDRLREESGIDAVALSGGVFLNALITSETVTRLSGDGFRVYRHRSVSPGDGGLCLGQLAIAAAATND
jgi:hydrogenase maturation protein HypF